MSYVSRPGDHAPPCRYAMTRRNEGCCAAQLDVDVDDFRRPSGQKDACAREHRTGGAAASSSGSATSSSQGDPGQQRKDADAGTKRADVRHVRGGL